MKPSGRHLAAVPDLPPDSGPVLSVVPDPVPDPEKDDNSPANRERIRKMYFVIAGLVTLVLGSAFFDVDKTVNGVLWKVASSVWNLRYRDSVPPEYVQRFCAINKVGPGYSAVCDGAVHSYPILEFRNPGKKFPVTEVDVDGDGKNYPVLEDGDPFADLYFGIITSVVDDVKASCPVEFPRGGDDGLVFQSKMDCEVVE